MTDKRPNILLILSDQHRFDCLSSNGHPLLQTPAMDRLAAEGARFRQATTPTPLCMPCRASLFTGQWPAQHLCIANTDTEAPSAPRMSSPSFAQVLKSVGYQTLYVGKWHVHPEIGPTDCGFDTYHPLETYPDWYYRRRGKQPHDEHSWMGTVDHDLHSENSMLAWGAQTLLEGIQTGLSDELPFLACWCPREPHLPSIVPADLADLYRPENIPPWPNFPDSLSGKPIMQRQQRMTWDVETWEWSRWAPIVSRYLATVHLLDMQIGRILDGLEEMGVPDNTIVIYSSDHGDMCGSHGMVDKHYVMYEEVVRVPLMVRWPAAIEPGTVFDDYVIHALDLPPTLCSAAGIGSPESYQGTSLIPLLTRRQPLNRTESFAVYSGNQFGLYSQRMVRTRQWKYVWNATAEDELYDLQNDPAELVNRSQDTQASATKRFLQERLVAWMEDTGDRLLNGWTRNQLLGGRSL